MRFSDWSSDVCSSYRAGQLALVVVRQTQSLVRDVPSLPPVELRARVCNDARPHLDVRREHDVTEKIHALRQRRDRVTRLEFEVQALGQKAFDLLAPFVQLLRAVADQHKVIAVADRSEERRVGKECVRTGRSRWSPYTKKNK